MQRGAQSELQAKGTLLKDIASWLEGTDDALENCMTGENTHKPYLPNYDLSHDKPFPGEGEIDFPVPFPGDGELDFPVAPGFFESQNRPALGWGNANPSAPGI